MGYPGDVIGGGVHVPGAQVFGDPGRDVCASRLGAGGVFGTADSAAP